MTMRSHIDYPWQVSSSNVGIKMCNKKDRQQSRCITNLSLLQPLLMVMTKLALSQQKLMWFLERQWPYTMQIKIIGTSSFTIIPTLEAIATAANGLQTLLHNPTNLMHLFGHGCMTAGCLKMLKTIIILKKCVPP